MDGGVDGDLAMTDDFHLFPSISIYFHLFPSILFPTFDFQRLTVLHVAFFFSHDKGHVFVISIFIHVLYIYISIYRRTLCRPGEFLGEVTG